MTDGTDKGSGDGPRRCRGTIKPPRPEHWFPESRRPPHTCRGAIDLRNERKEKNNESTHTDKGHTGKVSGLLLRQSMAQVGKDKKAHVLWGENDGRHRAMNESKLINDIMKELGKHGAVFRCNSGSVRLPNGRRFAAMPKGFSDIVFIRPDGIACFIECKTDTGRLSDEQERFISRMQELNARAGVARSVGEAVEICGMG